MTTATDTDSILPSATECDPALEKARALVREQQALRAAGELKNTRRSYESDLRHYERVFRGRLPASPAAIETYLMQYASTLSPVTLQRRLAALADFHVGQGYVDPTKTAGIATLMKGIRTKYNRAPRQARALSSGSVDLSNAKR